MRIARITDEASRAPTSRIQTLEASLGMYYLRRTMHAVLLNCVHDFGDLYRYVQNLVVIVRIEAALKRVPASLLKIVIARNLHYPRPNPAQTCYLA